MNIYRSKRNQRMETGNKQADHRPVAMSREEQIVNITQRKVAQGVSADEQYAALNKAREKRKRKRQRNIETLVSGGYKQVILLP